MSSSACGSIDNANLNNLPRYGDESLCNSIFNISQCNLKPNEEYNDQVFIDSRTGEYINLGDCNDVKNKTLIKNGRGRGNTIHTSSLIENHLQKQLRMARPIGFSNSSIELFYENNSSNEYSCVKTEKEEKEETTKVINEKLNIECENRKKKPRVKAIRNSKQKIALMLTLN